MSLIADAEGESKIKEYVDHLGTWAIEHAVLKPHALHIQAELACRSDPGEVPSNFLNI